MNRHQSNPFLSDWDEEPRTDLVRGSIFDTINTGDSSDQQQEGVSSAAVRRSSCSQMGAQSATGQANRQGLYRRNMSSFEAASCLQYEQERQLQQNGTSDDLLQQQRELIAKMTADFQSAIETNDKQFVDQLATFNPFDPFETIVDDDSMPSSAPNASGPASHEEASTLDRVSEMDLGAGAAGNRPTSRPHESIDDDEEELVSTPVRNIKSSPNNLANSAGMSLAGAQNGGHTATSAARDNGPATSCASSGGQDSIAKASLFASLLASAENTAVTSDEAGVSGAAERGQPDESPGQAATSHVIKGSPTAADGSSDRPVAFFDPFETVIDKDALTSLVSESQQSRPSEPAQAGGGGAAAAERSRGNELRATRVADSTSIETVIENQVSAAAGGSTSPSVAEPAPVGPETPSSRGQDEESGALSQDASAGLAPLARPTGTERLETASGITAPQPTPAKRPLKKQSVKTRAHRRGDAESDSSGSGSSSEEDDRIKVVIRARDATPAGVEQESKIFVPLLPPPPSKSSLKQARERGQVQEMPSPIMSYKTRQQQHREESDSDGEPKKAEREGRPDGFSDKGAANGENKDDDEADSAADDDGQFVIPMKLSDNEDDSEYAKPETPLYDEDTSYVLEEFPAKYEGPGWEMMLRYPPKKKLTTNRFWKKIFVKLAQVPLAPDNAKRQAAAAAAAGASGESSGEPGVCWALQIFDQREDRKPMQEILIQATYTVSELSSQLFDQFGKIFTVKLQYIFYKERVGVRQGQLARFIHTGHIGSSTTSGGHGVDPISIGAIKRMGAPIEHSPQISQIIKLGCTDYQHIRSFKEALEDCLFRMPIQRDRALSTYKTEEVQMAVRDETYIEINQVGQVTRQLARVRLFFLSFLNGTPLVEVGVNEHHRQGREVVGRMDILPVITEEWIRLEAWELHSTVDKAEFENEQSRLIKLTPPDATFFELMRFRVRPPRNRELPLQISANMTVTRTRVSINCNVMVPGCVSRKHGQIPCENIAIRIHIPECWIYFFREEKHFRMGSKKSVNRRPGKVKGIERFLGGGGGAGASALAEFSDESSLIEVTSGQAKYEHHHHAVVWRAARWPKESQSAYVQNNMKIRLPLTAYDKMPESFSEYLYVEYTTPATTVSHTTLRSIAVQPCDDEPPEKYVKYAAKYEYKVKMRLSVNLGNRRASQDAAAQPEASPIVIMKAPLAQADDGLEREKDEDDDDDDDDDDDRHHEDLQGDS